MASEIRIIPTSEEFYRVEVSGKIETKKSVTITELDYERFTGGRRTKEPFLLFAFEFLLEREENTSILREFSICKISEYFPEFEKEVIDWSRL